MRRSLKLYMLWVKGLFIASFLGIFVFLFKRGLLFCVVLGCKSSVALLLDSPLLMST